ncbi:MAG: MBL fold metallo-hydrolase, partial [Planctomycetota bacterium]
MKITVLGAGGGEVTGSSYLIQTSRARVLVDCGLFQGSNQVERLNRPSPKSLPNPLHGVVVTHAHLDHV